MRLDKGCVVLAVLLAVFPETGRGQGTSGKEETWFLGDAAEAGPPLGGGSAENPAPEEPPDAVAATGTTDEPDESAEATAVAEAAASERMAESGPEEQVEALWSRCGPPTLAETMAAADAAAGLGGDEEGELLSEARWAAVLPRIRVSVRRDWEHDESVDLEPDPADAGYDIDTDDDLELGVTAQWDLGAIVAPSSAPALRRLALESQEARRRLRLEVAGTYSEWCRLRLEWATATREGRRAELAWALAERAARLDALTGGFFRRALQGPASAGRQEPWSSARTSGTR